MSPPPGYLPVAATARIPGSPFSVQATVVAAVDPKDLDLESYVSDLEAKLHLIDENCCLVCKPHKALDTLSNNVYELNFRVKEVNQQGCQLLGK